MFLETKQHRKKYETQFCRLEKNKQGKIEVLRGKIIRR